MWCGRTCDRALRTRGPHGRACSISAAAGCPHFLRQSALDDSPEHPSNCPVAIASTDDVVDPSGLLGRALVYPLDLLLECRLGDLQEVVRRLDMRVVHQFRLQRLSCAEKSFHTCSGLCLHLSVDKSVSINRLLEANMFEEIRSSVIRAE